jgi:acetoin utilization protein AcuB
MLVKDIMTTSVTTVVPWDSIRHAATFLHEGGFRHLPVVEDGVLVWIISDRDVEEARIRGTMRALLTVESIMRQPVLTVTPETPLGEASRLMLERQISALPVLEGRRLVGILTPSDALGMLARAEMADKRA